MPCSIKNHSNYDTSEFEPLVQNLYNFAQNRFKFANAPSIDFVSDNNNNHLLGKTAHYDPSEMKITIFVDDRHPKDMMRSISHELVHHMQNEKGMFEKPVIGGAQYAQKDPHLRKMEAEAYLKGNMCFRDWEDGYKSQYRDIYYERRIRKMSTNKWKNKELNGLLNERWGFSMDLGKLNEAEGEKGDANPLGGKRKEFDKDLDNIPDGDDPNPNDPDNPDADDKPKSDKKENKDKKEDSDNQDTDDLSDVPSQLRKSVKKAQDKAKKNEGKHDKDEQKETNEIQAGTASLKQEKGQGLSQPKKGDKKVPHTKGQKKSQPQMQKEARVRKAAKEAMRRLKLQKRK